MSNNANLVISESLMFRIKSIADKCINREMNIDKGITEIGFTVDAYNEYFHTGRGKVSKEREAEC